MPFIVTVYLRRGRFGGMPRRDWRIFLLSWLIGNAWWSICGLRERARRAEHESFTVLVAALVHRFPAKKLSTRF